MSDVKISQLPLTNSVCNNALIPLVQNGTTFSTYACNIGGGGSSAIIINDSGTNSSVRCGANNCASGAYSSVVGGRFNTGSEKVIVVVGHIELMEKYYNLGFNFVKNVDFFPNITVEQSSKRWLATVIIEQVFIYSLIGENPKYKWEVFLYNNKYNFRYAHMVGASKRQPQVVNKIKERVALKDWN